ncbi:MAG: NYN domain-containing protein [Candidatus Promineofilum sp.]|nr:NYN domain-containing protein [Promineifilum sp.]MBP9657090.1 NYN domain-containing protein [Promineifilum sp.]
MNYLIDGHNLIARTPGLSLADPDDEVKLVQLLRRWSMADQRRKVTVIFDGGLPAGEAKQLSGGGVKAIFAPNNSTADAVLIRRIEAIGNPPEFVIVTSDRAIGDVARRRRVAVQSSESFAADMIADRQFGKGEKESARRPDAPAMTPDEMQEWLALFGPEPETPRPKPRAAKPKPQAPAAPKSKSPEEREAEEIDEWLRLFGYKE